MATTSASTKYIGYLGGVAVAAGVGAAIAVAGQGTAHADSGDGAAKESTSSTSSVNAGPKRGETKAGDTKRAKPLSKVKDSVKESIDKQADKIEKAAAHVTKTVQAAKPAKPVAVKPKPKPSAEEFEAGQVAKLKDLFAPKQAAAPKPTPVVEEKPDTETVAQPTSKTSVTPKVAAVQDQAATPWDPNPLRDNDPEPKDIPPEILDLRDALMGAAPNELKPLVREATEQIYRGTQIVPWVNAVIPISKILPSLAPALGDDDAARAARQTIINELIKTTPPGSAVYYGYDIIADLINLEEPGAELKVQAVTTVWDLLDPFELAHNKGESGIGNAAG
ncbi:hypothetical protein [Mycolicibacterium neworleansense]|uniref:Uncharacterized protein n=1 Tax=Mycolicibacterium neworleansense TaxID=146018 RepID=A0A0H5RPL2_9MYCO|nr:hypothetical protein [Mycolicibacterium neworleansense]CRZ15883.1 hypothetical protein BN2156_02747 [Mycolicibacterium neworleansense]